MPSPGSSPGKHVPAQHSASVAHGVRDPPQHCPVSHRPAQHDASSAQPPPGASHIAARHTLSTHAPSQHAPVVSHPPPAATQSDSIKRHVPSTHRPEQHSSSDSQRVPCSSQRAQQCPVAVVAHVSPTGHAKAGSPVVQQS